MFKRKKLCNYFSDNVYTNLLYLMLSFLNR
jgi:hypothetical protein